MYRKESPEALLKFFTSKKVFGRGLGRGQGEALVGPQVWTNFLTIHKMGMLEAASKVVLYTDDENFKNNNQIQDMENLELTKVSEGRSIAQIPTVGQANIQLFQQATDDFFSHAQLLGAAFDPILGEKPTSGTTFRGQERTVTQGEGLHKRRKGQRAKFIEEIYRDWMIKDMVKEIVRGKKFLATLSIDEMTWVSDQLSDNYANRKIIDDVLEGKVPQNKEELKKEYITLFSKKGNQHLIEILEDEFRDINIKIGINIAGKQKDLAFMSDKLLSIFQFIAANPQGFQQLMQVPSLAKNFNDILEYGNMSQVDFSSLMAIQNIQTETPQEISNKVINSPLDNSSKQEIMV